MHCLAVSGVRNTEFVGLLVLLLAILSWEDILLEVEKDILLLRTVNARMPGAEPPTKRVAEERREAVDSFIVSFCII